MPSYDFHARYALLTYAQCGDLDPWAVSNHFGQLEAECIVARETHEDGGIHLHVFVDFGRKRRFRDARKFDVLDHHPNIEQSRGNPGAGYDYACKEGDILAGGLERPSDSGRGMDNHHDQWTHLVGIEDRDEFFDAIRTLYPKSLITQFTQIQKYADWRFAIRPVEYKPPSCTFSYEGLEELNQWREKFIDHATGSNSGETGESKYVPLLGLLYGGTGDLPETDVSSRSHSLGSRLGYRTKINLSIWA